MSSCLAKGYLQAMQVGVPLKNNEDHRADIYFLVKAKKYSDSIFGVCKQISCTQWVGESEQ